MFKNPLLLIAVAALTILIGCAIHQFTAAASTASQHVPNLPFSSASSSYTHYLPINNMNSDTLHFFWRIVGRSTTQRPKIHFAISFVDRSPQDVNPSGAAYFAIGVTAAPASTMPGADIGAAILHNQKVEFFDYFARGFETPVLDPSDCQGGGGDNQDSSASSSPHAEKSDWYTTGFFSNSTATVIEGWRYLDIKDEKHDRAISENPTHETGLIFAVGAATTGLTDPRSINYHSTNTWQSRVNLFSSQHSISSSMSTLYLQSHFASSSSSSPPRNSLEASSFSYFRIGMTNHVIQPRETHYIQSPCVAVNYQEGVSSAAARPGSATGQSNLTGPAYIIGFSNDYQRNTTKYVHHIVLKAWSSDSCTMANGPSSDIYGAGYDETTFFEFPSNVHLNLANYKAISLELHYHNPSLDSGIIERSGVRLYYSTTPRAHSAAMLQIGDPAVQTRPSSIPVGVSSYEYECPSSCTSRFTENTLTVFAVFQHMHSKGISFENKFYKSSVSAQTSLTASSSDLTKPYATLSSSYYDYINQKFFLLDEPIEIAKGDVLKTTCTYQNEKSTRKFGLGSEDEMCISFIYYYSAMVSNSITPYRMCGPVLCGVQPQTRTVASPQALGREFGTGTCRPAGSAGDLTTKSVAAVGFVIIMMIFA